MQEDQTQYSRSDSVEEEEEEECDCECDGSEMVSLEELKKKSKMSKV